MVDHMDTSAPQHKQPIEIPPILPLVDAPRPPYSGLSSSGLAWALIIPLVGFIVSLVALSKAKAAGIISRKAVAGVIIGLSLFLIETASIVILIVTIAGGLTPSTRAFSLCSDQNDTGTVVVDGSTYSCSPV